MVNTAVVSSSSASVDLSSKSLAGRWIEGVTAEMPLLEALETIFRQRCDAVLHFLPRATVYDPDEDEPIHKLRVAARRLSAVLDVLAEGFAEAPRKSLYRVVQKIRRACGTARDLDVRRQFLEELLPRASVEDAGIIEILCDKLIRDRERLQRKLGRKLLRFERRLRRGGAELIETLEMVRERDDSSYGTFGQIGERILLKELNVVWNRAADDRESPRGLHRLRIACKQLRYAAEIFFPVLNPELRDVYYPPLERVQELLGEIHDAAVASEVIGRQHKKWRRRRQDRDWTGGGLAAFSKRELHAAINGILDAYSQRAVRASHEFQELWGGFSGDGFRLPVTRLLAKSGNPGIDSVVQPREMKAPSETDRSAGFSQASAANGATPVPESALQNGAGRAVMPGGGE